MPGWTDTLARFSVAIREGVALAPAEAVCLRYTLTRATEVYRNNYRGNLHDALAAVYPVIGELVGAPFFRQLARQFIERHASRSSNLHDYGSAMAEFLVHFEPVRHLPYLPDMAKLEWACHRAYFAIDAAEFDFNRLAAIAAEFYPDLRWHLHPGCTLLDSVYPVAAIWQAHQDGSVAESEIDLANGGATLLIHRHELQTHILSMTPAAYHCLGQLQQGVLMGEASESTLALDPEFDLAANLRNWTAQGVLVGFDLSDRVVSTAN